MNQRACATPILLPELLVFWLGEMDESSNAPCEEHLFACTECSGRLGRLIELARAIRHELVAGRLSSVLSATFVQRLKDAGMRVREYRVEPGGSVHCTVAPDDDLVVSRLGASLRYVHRLDLIFELDPSEGGARWRLEDIAFDRASDEVVFAPSVAELRKLGVSTQHARLVAVDADGERVIGSYTFDHSPFR